MNKVANDRDNDQAGHYSTEQLPLINSKSRLYLEASEPALQMSTARLNEIYNTER